MPSEDELFWCLALDHLLVGGSGGGCAVWACGALRLLTRRCGAVGPALCRRR